MVRHWCSCQQGIALQPNCKVHYNRLVRSLPRPLILAACGLSLLFLGWPMRPAQQAPAASGARILLLPHKLVSGERATLAVLDVSGRLTPSVNVMFSNGDKVTTDATGRALFVAPLNPGTIFASIAGRGGRVVSTIVSPTDVPSSTEEVTAAPRFASLSDRF
jgi:hypothetical protein